jgi:hypothetical protein
MYSPIPSLPTAARKVKALVLALSRAPSGEPIEFAVAAKNRMQFLAAAEAIDTPPEKLLADAIHLCADTAIALAVPRQPSQSA